MDELEFRAWHRNKRKMLEVSWIDFSKGEISGTWMDGEAVETGRLPLDSCDVIQFTGLHDMKRRKIFEGDIVDDTHGRIGIQQSTLVVKWREEQAGFVLFDTMNRPLPWHPHLLEVIGNINENRSLLETR